MVVGVELELLEPLVLEEVEEEEEELEPAADDVDDDDEVVVGDVVMGWNGIRPIAVEVEVLDVDEGL